jgi:hypothetical protein
LEPVPLEPGVAGVVGAVGAVVLDPLPEEPLELPMPEEPLPALEPLRASRWHLSSDAPVRPTHLLASLPDAPAAPEALPEVELSLLPEDEPLAEGAVVLLPAEPEPEAPVLPELEPEDWANATLDSARSAAAVAAVRVFNIMREISFEGG